jgi:hypothetical protein
LDLAGSLDLASSLVKDSTVIWLVLIPTHCKALIVSVVLVSIPAHCKAEIVSAVFMPAIWQLRVIFLTMVLGEAGQELVTAAKLEAALWCTLQCLIVKILV